LQETVDVPDPLMLLGLIDPQLRPEGIVSVRDTVPVNPLSAETVIVDVADWPALTEVAEVGEVAEIEKSALGVLKNSVIAVALASFEVMVARPQLVSIVLVNA
jgi:hypothetical protein